MHVHIKKVDAFSVNGKTYPTELSAIIAAVASRIGNNAAIARNITDSAADLIPLLQRVLDLQTSAKNHPEAPAPDHPEVPAPDHLEASLAPRWRCNHCREEWTHSEGPPPRCITSSLTGPCELEFAAHDIRELP